MSGTERDRVPETYLTPQEVVERFSGKLKLNTLANWRVGRKKDGIGPDFIKAGGKVLYPLSKLERWEELQTISSTDADQT